MDFAMGTRMQSTTTSVTLCGLDAHLVRVEVDSGRGLPSFHLVGQAATVVRESRVRVRAALRHLNVELNEWVILVNLAPAYLRKTGSAHDLAIAIGVLAALGRVSARMLDHTLLLGELSLTGEIRSVNGVLPALLGARERGITHAIVPAANASEAAVVDGIDTRVATTLPDIVAHLDGATTLPVAEREPPTSGRRAVQRDLADVRGQRLPFR